MIDIALYRDMFAKNALPYYQDIPYHNFSHATQVEARARDIAQHLDLQTIDLLSVSLAARMHDAGYHENTTYTYKEDYSIFLMKQASEKIFASLPSDQKERIISNAISGINWTKIDCDTFPTQFHKILRAADTFAIWTPNTHSFLKQTANIYHEYSQLNKKKLIEQHIYPLPHELFTQKQSVILLDILNITKQHIPEHPYFFPWYYNQARKNIQHLQDHGVEQYLSPYL